MPQICDMGQTALLPFRRKACWGFFRPKKSDGLGRVLLLLLLLYKSSFSASVSGLYNNRPSVRPHSKALLPCSGLVLCLMIGCEGVRVEHYAIPTLLPGFDKRLYAGGNNPLTGTHTFSGCLKALNWSCMCEDSASACELNLSYGAVVTNAARIRLWASSSL
jgi:hypothetical protein